MAWQACTSVPNQRLPLEEVLLVNGPCRDAVGRVGHQGCFKGHRLGTRVCMRLLHIPLYSVMSLLTAVPTDLYICRAVHFG